MSVVLTVGMWSHLLLIGDYLFEPTANPIWGELRLVPAYLMTWGLWGVLAWVL